jgi:hypothetical protein
MIMPSEVGWALTVALLAVGVGAAGAAPEELPEPLLQPAAISASAAAATPTTATWRPLRRIVPGFRYVITVLVSLSGVVCSALCARWPCGAGLRMACSRDSPAAEDQVPVAFI